MRVASADGGRAAHTVSIAYTHNGDADMKIAEVAMMQDDGGYWFVVELPMKDTKGEMKMKKIFLILAAVVLSSCVTNQNTLPYPEPTESEIYGKSAENGWVHVKNVPAKRYFILLGGLWFIFEC